MSTPFFPPWVSKANKNQSRLRGLLHWHTLGLADLAIPWPVTETMLAREAQGVVSPPPRVWVCVIPLLFVFSASLLAPWMQQVFLGGKRDVLLICTLCEHEFFI